MREPADLPPTSAGGRTALTVSELNRQARDLLERGLGRLWVEGEVSNLARPASGHLYFTLKDDSAQVRCAWFRQRQHRTQAKALAAGDQMLAFGRISLYEPRGDYQLIVEELEPAGIGELRQRFEALKRKLDAEGLFDLALKRELPALPRRIGIISSPSGAAVHDILTVLRRRFASIPVVVYPAAVQGDAAVPELIAALGAAARRAECDVLIIGRGGGSLEDLWAFNDEALARAVRNSPIPVISAVGHEVDFSITDLVADVRAPTPSGAAELAVPDQREWLRALAVTRRRLIGVAGRALEDRSQAVDWLSRRLIQSSPANSVARQSQRLAAAARALAGAMRHDLVSRDRRLAGLSARLLRRAPDARLAESSLRLERLLARLASTGNRRIDGLRSRLAVAGRALDSVSPLATLERGYAIVTETTGGRIVTDAGSLAEGDLIEARLARGRITARVTRTPSESDN